MIYKKKGLPHKKGLAYDWLDFVGSLLFLVGGILLAFLLIAANRMQSVDTKYVLTEKVEIMDQTAYFMNLPLSHITIERNRLTAQERTYLEEARRQGNVIYDLFVQRMVDSEARSLLEKAVQQNPLFQKYKITIDAIDFPDAKQIDTDELVRTIQSTNGTLYEIPYHDIEIASQVIETDLRCSFDEAVKKVTFTLPLPLHPSRQNQQIQIQYCHRVRYFEDG